MNFSQSFLFITLITLLSIYPTIANANAFDPPPGQGAPKGTSGGGSRPVTPSCAIPPNSSDLPILLAPKTYLGLTTQSHPTFWVYLPKTSAKTIEFSLFDANRKGLYQVSLPMPKSAGLTSISLPKTIPGLTIDRPYHWTIALVCNPKRRTEDWVNGGWIQRQQPSEKLQQDLKAADLKAADLKASDSPMHQADRYLQSNFWYDAMTILIQPQFSSSITFKELWSTAFDTAGITRITIP